MKVSEAKEKVCPFIKNDGEYAWQLAHNKQYNPENIKCICGDCMAWEWIEFHYKCDNCGDEFDIEECYEDGCDKCGSKNVTKMHGVNHGYCKRLKK